MSAPPKRGLGRGLAALLGEEPMPVSPAPLQAEVVREIPLDAIRPNPGQPRKHFDPLSLDELKASVAEHGVLVPVIVRELGDGYELVAGERRWRACAALERATIPAIVRPCGDRESLEVAIIENLQRENLNPLEEATGIAQLIEAHGFTQEQVAQRLGKARTSITNALRLLTLSEPIKVMIADGRLSAGHAKALLGAPESARLELARRAAADGLPVRALERVVAALLAPAAPKERPQRRVAPDDAEFIDRMRTRFGAPVALRRGSHGGSVEIGFSSEDDLIRIAEILLGE
jgi:ParB family chromosome partitioning protein